jgi:hypothetical protein
MKAAHSFKFTRSNVQQIRPPEQVLNIPDEEIEVNPLRHRQAIKLEACDKKYKPEEKKASKFQRK